MTSSSTSLTPKRAIIGIAAVIVLIGLWYAFRPEKLFINKRVNEAAPATAQGALVPVFTGRFVSGAHKTVGRATIYKQADGTHLLRLTDFATSNGPEVRVLLVAAPSPDVGKNFPLNSVKNVDLGDLKGNQGDQSYPIPANADPQQFNTVMIYCVRFHANFGTAALQDF